MSSAAVHPDESPPIYVDVNKHDETVETEALVGKDSDYDVESGGTLTVDQSSLPEYVRNGKCIRLIEIRAH